VDISKLDDWTCGERFLCVAWFNSLISQRPLGFSLVRCGLFVLGIDMNEYDAFRASCASAEEKFAGDHDDNDYDTGSDKIIETGYRSLLQVLVQPPGYTNNTHVIM